MTVILTANINSQTTPFYRNSFKSNSATKTENTYFGITRVIVNKKQDIKLIEYQ